jgi:hypothetical protein
MSETMVAMIMSKPEAPLARMVLWWLTVDHALCTWDLAGVRAMLWPQATSFSWDITSIWKWTAVWSKSNVLTRVSLIAGLPHSQSSPAVSSTCTKVLYFTDRSLTPFMVNIPKRWDEMLGSLFFCKKGKQGRTVRDFPNEELKGVWKAIVWIEELKGETPVLTLAVTSGTVKATLLL